MKVYIVLLVLPVLFTIPAEVVHGYDLTFSGTVEEIYDDNISAASNASEKKYDFITSLILGLNVQHESRSGQLALMGHLYQEIYAQHSDFNNTSEDAVFLYAHELSSTNRFLLQNVFHHYPEPQTFSDVFSRAGSTDEYWVNTATFTYIYELLRQLSVNVMYKNQLNRYLDGDTNDSTLHEAGSIIHYSLTSAHIVSLLYNYSYMDVANEGSVVDHEIGIQYQYFITKQLYAICRTGMNYIQAYDDKIYTDPFLFLTLENDVNERMHVSIRIGKEYTANVNSADIYEYSSAKASGRMDVMKRCSLEINSFYGYGEYQNTGVRYRLTGMGVSATYECTKNINGQVRYTYEHSTSSDEDGSMNRNNILLSVSGKF